MYYLDKQQLGNEVETISFKNTAAVTKYNMRDNTENIFFLSMYKKGPKNCVILFSINPHTLQTEKKNQQFRADEKKKSVQSQFKCNSNNLHEGEH